MTIRCYLSKALYPHAPVVVEGDDGETVIMSIDEAVELHRQLLEMPVDESRELYDQLTDVLAQVGDEMLYPDAQEN